MSQLHVVCREGLSLSENRSTAFPKKSQVRSGIRTRLVQIECRDSATCATTTANMGKKFNQ